MRLLQGDSGIVYNFYPVGSSKIIPRCRNIRDCDMLYFITGNEDKFREVKLLIPNIKQLDIDLPEIQDLDPKLFKF